MAAKRKKTIIKKGKKKWAQIYAPALFGETLLGESYVFETEDLKGKYLTANLSTITKNMRKQNANVQFKVVKVEDGKGKTEVVGYSMINSALKRLVKRGRDKVADSFICKTSDKQLIRIKPLLITSTLTTKLIQSACRLETRRVIREYVVTTTIEGTIQSIVDGKIQKIVKDALKKIFPIKNIDIRIAKLIENSKIVVTDKEVVSEPVKKRKLTKSEEAQIWKEKKQESNTYVQEEDIPSSTLDASEEDDSEEDESDVEEETETEENNSDVEEDSEEDDSDLEEEIEDKKE